MALLAAIRSGAGVGRAEVALRVGLAVALDDDAEAGALACDRRPQAGERVARGERQPEDGSEALSEARRGADPERTAGPSERATRWQCQDRPPPAKP
jgi:hypothetical protein